MPTVCLVDTNILVYAFDPAESVKQDQARAIIRAVNASGVGRLECTGAG